jgi:hypothetical protein
MSKYLKRSTWKEIYKLSRGKLSSTVVMVESIISYLILHIASEKENCHVFGK